MGFLDAAGRGLRRWTDSLSHDEERQLFAGREKSDSVGIYFGQVLVPTTTSDWQEAVCVIFRDGSGTVDYVFRDSSGSRSFGYCEQWTAGSATNGADTDGTPLLIGPGGIPFDDVKGRLFPAETEPLAFGELMLAFEKYGNDYDSDGYSSWVSGASHGPTTVFRAMILGRAIGILEKRTSGRRPW